MTIIIVIVSLFFTQRKNDNDYKVSIYKFGLYNYIRGTCPPLQNSPLNKTKTRN